MTTAWPKKNHLKHCKRNSVSLVKQDFIFYTHASISTYILVLSGIETKIIVKIVYLHKHFRFFFIKVKLKFTGSGTGSKEDAHTIIIKKKQDWGMFSTMITNYFIWEIIVYEDHKNMVQVLNGRRKWLTLLTSIRDKITSFQRLWNNRTWSFHLTQNWS